MPLACNQSFSGMAAALRMIAMQNNGIENNTKAMPVTE